MRVETKVNIYNTLFISVLFGTTLTIVGGLISNGSVDWDNFLVEVFVGIAIGLFVGIVIPVGKLATSLASKVSKPGTLLFKFIMNTVLLLIILLFMCPLMTLFTGCVIMGAPISVILPNLYSLFVPFFLIALAILMIFGDYIMKLSMKCAGVPNMVNKENV